MVVVELLLPEAQDQYSSRGSHEESNELSVSAVICMLGTFLVNSVPAVVMFDSGATHSFVSRTFSESLGRMVGRLGCPLVVEVAGDGTLTVTDVYRGCTLEISGVRFPIDLIPIAMRELCVIVGMVWMDMFDAEMVCRHKQMRVRTPSGRELLVQGDSPRQTSAICSAARARRYLQHRGQGYLAYVIDTRVDEGSKLVVVGIEGRF